MIRPKMAFGLIPAIKKKCATLKKTVVKKNENQGGSQEMAVMVCYRQKF